MFLRSLAFAVAAVAMTTPAIAATPREMLVAAAFSARTKAQALSQVEAARIAAEAILARQPNDREAQLQRAIAIGYRAKLNRGLGDAKEARRQLEALVAADPRNAEAHAALGGWHMDAVAKLGRFVASTMLGANKAAGLQQMALAMKLGGNRALFPAMAALTRIQQDRDDVAPARALAVQATEAATPTPLDRIIQRAAAAVLVPLRANDGGGAQALAETLLPFGRLEG